MARTNYFLLISLLCYCYSFGFQSKDKTPLTQVITELEAKFEVKFSYAVEDVKNVWVNSIDQSASLKQIIATLNNTTALQFTFLNSRYITISTLNKTITICGVLIDYKNKEPLVNASIVIANSIQGTVTDNQGKFKLSNVPANKRVTISFLGYKPEQFKARYFKAREGLCKTVEMTEQTEELNTILITKYLTTGLQKRIDGSTTLNTEEFGILPGLTQPDILQSIQALPGIESVNESVANINVRGGTNDQNLMLWDGIKMYHSGHFFGLISAYNPYLTDKVIVTKNGTSSEFSDGVSSTINMSTKNKINKKISGGAVANLISANGFLEIPLNKKLALHISGRRSFTDLFDTPTYNRYFERSFQDSELTSDNKDITESIKSSKFLFYDYTAKLLYNLNKNHKFRATVIGINNHLEYTQTKQNKEGITESKTNNLQQKNLGLGANWNAVWNKKLTTSVNTFYSHYTVDATNYKIETDQELKQGNEVLETGIKLTAKYKVNPTINLLNGYEFNETGILNKTIVNSPSYEKRKKDVLLNHAIFSEIEYHKFNTYIRLGVRGNYFQKFNTFIIEPRLSFRQKISNQFSVNIQGEFKNQSANQKIDFENNFLGVENRRWVLANNKDIPISKSKQISFGVAYNQNNWLITVTPFYKLVNGITTSNQGFYNNFQYTAAIGDYTAKGTELLLNKTATNYSGWLSYTYSTNNYTFKSFTPSIFPNNVDIRHSVSLAFNYNIADNVKVSFGGIWRSGQPYTRPVKGNETVKDGTTIKVNYDTPNNERLANFIRLDTSLNYNFNVTKSVKGMVRAGVLNVLNKRNTINRYYKVNSEDTNTTVQIDNKSLGLTPNLSVRIKF
ncbi:carboxypeptidase-like regulatory domain-containing protein [Tenacibaculum sp. UWU-22]|uniref:TonB-dependent receptor n=1 Tax=Tenacibaculum sp. UWU-22 TaxID=3234187 RepID=UPI0034DB7C38